MLVSLRDLVNDAIRGHDMLYGKDGRLKPFANIIYSRAMKRMATDKPEDIVRDLESQIKLLVK